MGPRVIHRTQPATSRPGTRGYTINFSNLELSAELKENLATLQYLEMTPIQAESLPAVLQRRDVIAQARTGSGKTAVFGLGILQSLAPKAFNLQALVLCPTRELAEQVATEIRRLARSLGNIKVVTVCGGTPVRKQLDSLRNGIHIAVGTPGRVEDLLRREALDPTTLNTLVLDEADRMLDMGFQDSLDAIIAQLPPKRQTLLFSATFPDTTATIAARVMHEPMHVKTDAEHDHNTIEQQFFQVDDGQRLAAVESLLRQHQPDSALVFCSTRRETAAVAKSLAGAGFSALALHGDMDQRDRDQTLVRFANQSATILVATDVAARGLDIDSLDLVINYQPANNSDVHTHRVGRTGRAGQKGLALTIFSDREKHKISLLAQAGGIQPELKPIRINASDNTRAAPAPMVTLLINGGKKQKLRPTDILGALTADGGIEGASVGKIKLFANHAYVAVTRRSVPVAVEKISRGKMKGRTFKVRVLN